jgi:hypothetical protein
VLAESTFDAAKPLSNGASKRGFGGIWAMRHKGTFMNQERGGFGASSNREAARITTHVSLISSAGPLATES